MGIFFGGSSGMSGFLSPYLDVPLLSPNLPIHLFSERISPLAPFPKLTGVASFSLPFFPRPPVSGIIFPAVFSPLFVLGSSHPHSPLFLPEYLDSAAPPTPLTYPTSSFPPPMPPHRNVTICLRMVVPASGLLSNSNFRHGDSPPRPTSVLAK